MTKVQELIDSIRHGRTAIANETFANIMKDKCNDAIEQRKIAVAQRIFNEE